MLEESGWKDQLKKDCLQYAQDHTSSNTSSKKVDDGSTSPFKDVSLESMLSALTSKSKGTVLREVLCLLNLTKLQKDGRLTL